MQSRFHKYIVVAVLALLSGIYQQEHTIPNQEIVLQFSHANVTSNETETTIAIVTQQLQDLGVNNIQVNQEQNGTLKISYYSDADVSIIKKTLSEDKEFRAAITSAQSEESQNFPEQKDAINYNLNIYEIQKSIDIDWSTEGTIVVELKSESDRSTTSVVYVTNNIDYSKNLYIQLAYKAHGNTDISVQNAPYTIPEVRAGPQS